MFSFLRKVFIRPFQTLNLISISREAILSNFDLYRSLHPELSIFPVLKSNAYGHGIREIASILRDRKLDYIVVDSYYEALDVHEVNKVRILLMGYTLSENFPYMDFSFITPVIYDYETLEALGKTKKKIRIHLKIDTGMHRQGIYPEEIQTYLNMIRKYPNLTLEGVCTHLADADNPDSTETLKWIEIFNKSVELIRSQGFSLRYIHAANSAWWTRDLPGIFTAMRLGIGLYGINPLEPTDLSYKKLAPLRPALRLESTLVLKKAIKKGDQVSYNGTFIAPRDMTIGIIPVGYYEGISRLLGGKKFWYSWNSNHFPILGRVCMNMTMVDLGQSSIQTGERIVILSDDPKDPNSIYEMASAIGTIPYECLTGISESIRRKIT